MEVFQRSVTMFVAIVSLCLVVITLFYSVNVIDMVRKRKDESIKEK